MTDISHTIFQDLSASSTGDLLACSGVEQGKQRVLRRLLTNPGDYIWHPDYGAGLARQVGELADIKRVRALIRGQMLQEAAVAQSPEPEITVIQIQGGLQCAIRYTDAGTQAPVSLNFNVNA
jgi:phage baseplate assembly protein W